MDPTADLKLMSRVELDDLLIDRVGSKSNCMYRKLVRWIMTNQAEILDRRIFSPRLQRNSLDKSELKSKLSISLLVCSVLIAINLFFRYKHDNFKLKLRNLIQERGENSVLILVLEASELEHKLKTYVGLPFSNYLYVVQPLYLYALWIIFTHFALQIYDRYIKMLRPSYITALTYPEVDIIDHDLLVEEQLKKINRSTHNYILVILQPKSTISHKYGLARVGSSRSSKMDSEKLVQDCVKFRALLASVASTRELLMYSRRPEHLNRLAKYYLIFWFYYTVSSWMTLVYLLRKTLLINKIPLTSMDLFSLVVLLYVTVVAMNTACIVLGSFIFASIDQVMLINKLIEEVKSCIKRNQKLYIELLSQHSSTQDLIMDQMNMHLISIYLHFKTFAAQLKNALDVMKVDALAIFQTTFASIIQAAVHAPSLDGDIYHLYLIGSLLLVFWTDATMLPLCMMQSRSLDLTECMTKLFAHTLELDQLSSQINKSELARPVYNRHTCRQIRKEVDQLEILVDCFTPRLLGTRMRLTYNSMLKAHLYMSLLIISLLKGFGLTITLL